MKKSIYELELHETTQLKFGIHVMRVPGGWVYDCWNIEKDGFKNGTFIPFNNEFRKPIKFDTPKYKRSEIKRAIISIENDMLFMKNNNIEKDLVKQYMNVLEILK